MSLMRLPAAGEENWCFGKGGTLPQGSSACTMGSASDPLEGESAEESGNGFCSSMGRKKRQWLIRCKHCGQTALACTALTLPVLSDSSHNTVFGLQICY